MILGDYHTHTTYSHGKGSILDSAKRAAEVGLKQIAITDHGFEHRLYNVRRRDLGKIRREIGEANEQFSGGEVLLGVEANLLDRNGTVDIVDEDFEHIDILLCGFHLFSRSTSARELFGFNLPVFWAGMFRSSQKRLLVSNTDAYIKAMERYPIDIITHPQYGLRVDVKALAEAAAFYNVYLELNGKRIAFSPQQAEIMQNAGARFIINSDAHSADRVGEISVPLAFAKEAGIDLESVVNWNKIPTFKRFNLNNEKK